MIVTPPYKENSNLTFLNLAFKLSVSWFSLNLTASCCTNKDYLFLSLLCARNMRSFRISKTNFNNSAGYCCVNVFRLQPTQLTAEKHCHPPPAEPWTPVFPPLSEEHRLAECDRHQGARSGMAMSKTSPPSPCVCHPHFQFWGTFSPCV